MLLRTVVISTSKAATPSLRDGSNAYTVCPAGVVASVSREPPLPGTNSMACKSPPPLMSIVAPAATVTLALLSTRPFDGSTGEVPSGRTTALPSALRASSG